MCENYKISKIMKRFISLVIIAFSMLIHIVSQNISPFITLQDGRKVNNEYAILDGDICTFCTNQVNKQYNWAFAFYEKQTGALMQVLRTNEQMCFFTINPSLIDWYNAKCYEMKRDSSVYYKGMVFLLDGQKKVDSLNVRFNLLPSIPKIKDASFTYTEYDWEHDDFFPNAVFKMYFQSERCDKVLLYTGEPFYFEPPISYYFRFITIVNPYSSNGMLSISTNDADWGQCYKIIPGNKYGWGISNDTLFTTNYIYDSNILARLEELKKELSSVSCVTKESEFRIINKNNHIEIEGDKSSIQSLLLYNVAGKLIMNQREGDKMDISNLPSGVYVVFCRTKDNQILTEKIVKQ